MHGASVSFEMKGDKLTERFFNRMLNYSPVSKLKECGEYGVSVLAKRTPKRTGLTSECWAYDIVKESTSRYSMYFTNINVTPTGIPIVYLIQYGHVMPNGGYVAPNNFITPAVDEIFRKLSDGTWEEVKK